MTDDEDCEVETEERAIYGIITLAACPVVIGVVIEGGTLDAGGTMSLMIVVLGVIGLLAGLRAFSKPRLPPARIHRRP